MRTSNSTLRHMYVLSTRTPPKRSKRTTSYTRITMWSHLKPWRFVYYIPCTRLQNFVNVSPLIMTLLPPGHLCFTNTCLVKISVLCCEFDVYCSLRDLQCDIIAGLTVGLTVIPQGLAYAKIANLPAQVCIYIGRFHVYHIYKAVTLEIMVNTSFVRII